MKRLLRTRLALLGCALLLQIPAFAQWHPFVWAEQHLPGLSSHKSAILLPVELNSIHCQMQLDTGADTSILYRNALPAQLSPEAGSGQLRSAQLHLGAEVSERTFKLLYSSRSGGQPTQCDSVVGTIGNDYLSGARITLDLPLAQFQLRRGGEPAPSLRSAAKAHVLDMDLLETGHGGVVPVLSATLANGKAIKLMLDTGSAPADIIVFLERNWLKLVGMPNIAAATAVTSTRWGHPLTCYSGPSKEALTLTGITLKAGTIVSYCADPTETASEQNILFGIIGLAPFRNERITLDYVTRKFTIEPSGARH